MTRQLNRWTLPAFSGAIGAVAVMLAYLLMPAAASAQSGGGCTECVADDNCYNVCGSCPGQRCNCNAAGACKIQ